MNAAPPDLRQQKRDLRLVMEARRAAALRQNPEAPLALRDVFMRHVAVPPGAVVGAYMACGSEMDLMPLLEALGARGFKLALPVVVGKQQPLAFRGYRCGEALRAGVMGIGEPPPSAPLVAPSIFLVPLLAFDRRGCRLGYGGGYYDRTLAAVRQRHRIQAIGVGFADQEVASVPAGNDDACLDAVLTEKEFFCV